MPIQVASGAGRLYRQIAEEIRLRIADATFRLSQGEQIIRVSGDVGYNDLSRFYKQFRLSTRQSPKYCQAKLTSSGK